ncbi:MAG TPA: ABC transporter permease, partial [Gemmatimonadales bacterium]|nr:ABC transporter permease [Gemmatimonadales bacterium]
MKRRSPVRALGVAALATLAALGALALGLELAGYDALRALGAMWRGAFGSWYAVTSATLVRAVPLVVLGLAVALAFHAGAFNIGAEGQFHAGAVAATWIGLLAGGWHPALAVTASWAAALLAGALWVSVPAWLRARFGVLEVISTLLLNFVADALVSLLVQGPLKERNGIYPQSDPIALAARLPLLSGTRLHLGLAVALGLAAALAVTLERTHAGFRLRAVGAGPEAARASGRIDVTRVVVAALLASGALAGLAGALEVGGV